MTTLYVAVSLFAIITTGANVIAELRFRWRWAHQVHVQELREKTSE